MQPCDSNISICALGCHCAVDDGANVAVTVTVVTVLATLRAPVNVGKPRETFAVASIGCLTRFTKIYTALKNGVLE